MNHLFYFYKQIHHFAGKKLYFNLIGMILISLLDGIGILLLIPLISMSGIVSFEIGDNRLTGFFEWFQAIPTSVGLPVILGMFVLISFGQNLINRLISIQNAEIQHGFFRHLRVQTYKSLLQANWGFFVRKRKSDLINILTAEIARASAGTNSFLQFMTSLIFTVIQIGIAFWLSPNITIFVLLSGLFLLFFSRKFLSRSFALGNRTFELGQRYLGGVTDQMNGIKDIKSNTLEESRMSWYEDVTNDMKNEQLAYTILKTKSQFNYKMASAILIAAFIYLSIHLFNAQAAQLMLILVIFSRLWPRVAGIQGSLEQLSSYLPAFSNVLKLQQEASEAVEMSQDNEKDVRPIQIKQAINCKDVSFRYHQDIPNYALSQLNLLIPANKMTAVVGPSGAGKSTLIDLLMGLNQPETGQIFLDGVPLTSSNLKAWRQAISYVPQEPFLFNETVRENLLLIKEDASEEEMWEALEFSSAAEFVQKLPQALDTVIGDRGIRLSGGERQRLVLARAILRKPSILILDEATSSLDTENEAKIQEAIERLKGRMTIVVIAHRLSTIRNADQVVVLESGKIIQKGEFGQLAKEKTGKFSHLLGKQMEVR
ncbi:ABC transporter ATP-binding protein [Bacillus alkalicellulosilyticus]|uniref:ABC transporter ATP-binding protein n=1 Tax=Alkalihalobacterium alkalicellulosilyticum TaxID=1912214 RepID=UPI000996312F|nr:ABC transporter ATP-binding protein [Bacillus alkalicellulosilyticus]